MVIFPPKRTIYSQRRVASGEWPGAPEPTRRFRSELRRSASGSASLAGGLGLGVTSVFVAPVLTRRMRRTRVLWLGLAVLSADLVAAGLLVDSPSALVACIVVGGFLLGVLNTVLTECVMEASDLPCPVASRAYSSARFLG